MCKNTYTRPNFDSYVLLKDNAVLKIKPELFDEWDFKKNIQLDLDIYKITRGSDKYAWWICPKCKCSYKSRISNRFNGKSCSYCSSKKVNHTNSLATINPELAKEWHPTKNGELMPINVTVRSNKKVWWLGTCGHDWSATVDSRTRGSDCPYCESASKKIKIGFNDMWTTNSELASLLANPEDGYKYTQKSDKKVDWKCPDCGKLSKNKKISNINNRGLSCQFCSDGYSYPEKFMNNLLSSMDVDFLYQKSFNWSEGKIYDFYLPSINMIIEMHGEQHIIHSGFERMGGESLEQVQANDTLKHELAIRNGIDNYITIDCVYSNFKYIKNNIMNSKINTFFNLRDFDWEEFRYLLDTKKSLVIEACDLYNKGVTQSKITEVLKISFTTLYKYLKIGNEIGLCKYETYMIENKKTFYQNLKKEVVQLDLNGYYIRDFKSITEAVLHLNKSSGNSSISRCCRGEQEYAFGYKWLFKNDYNLYLEGLLDIKKVENKNKRKVVQLTLDNEYITTYDSLKLAMDSSNAHRNHIGNCCKGIYSQSGGFRWMYLEDYEKMMHGKIDE